jgi:hypothetical protein
MRVWVRACGLRSLVVYFNVETCDIWEEKVTTRREIYIENLRFRGLWDMREGLSDIKEVDIVEVRV